jgi:uncharacterized membrane protein YqjE
MIKVILKNVFKAISFILLALVLIAVCTIYFNLPSYVEKALYIVVSVIVANYYFDVVEKSWHVRKSQKSN